MGRGICYLHGAAQVVDSRRHMTTYRATEKRKHRRIRRGRPSTSGMSRVGRENWKIHQKDTYEDVPKGRRRNYPAADNYHGRPSKPIWRPTDGSERHTRNRGEQGTDHRNVATNTRGTARDARNRRKHGAARRTPR